MDVATHYPPLLFTGCRQLLVTDALLESCLERQHEVSGQLEAAEAGLEQLQERVVRVLGGRGIAEDALKRTQSSLRHYRSRFVRLEATIKSLQAGSGSESAAVKDQRDISALLGPNWWQTITDGKRQLQQCLQHRDAVQLELLQLQERQRLIAHKAIEQQHELNLAEQRAVDADGKLRAAQATIDRQEAHIMELVGALAEAESSLHAFQEDCGSEGSTKTGPFINTMKGNEYDVQFRTDYQQWLSKYGQVGGKLQESFYELLAMLMGISVEVRCCCAWPWLEICCSQLRCLLLMHFILCRRSRCKCGCPPVPPPTATRRLFST